MRVSAEKWKQHFAAQLGMGLTVDAYCRRHQLPKSGWYYWQTKLKSFGIGNRPAMVPVVVKGGMVDSPRIAVRLPNGIQVAINDDVDPGRLRLVVVALQGIHP